MLTQSITQDQNVELQQTFSPLLMQANHILSLSQAELEAAVNDAIEENPALELEDCAICPVCGRRTSGEPCATCRSAPIEPPPVLRGEDSLPRSEPEYRTLGSPDPEFDPMTFIASATDLREQILESAVASLETDLEQAIALILVDAIDDRGFLSLSVEDIASEIGADVPTVEGVLAVIQEVAPAGVGARTLQESLLLQVAFLRAEGVSVPETVPAILKEHLEELATKRIARIAKALSVDAAEVEAALSFIRDQLTPHPLQAQQASTWTAPSEGGHVVPDVIISLEGEQLSIEVPNAIYDRLHTEAFYRAIAKPDTVSKDTPSVVEPPAAVDPEAMNHARAQVARAQQFIWAVRQRRQTLLRVAEYVCAYQEAYIR